MILPFGSKGNPTVGGGSKASTPSSASLAGHHGRLNQASLSISMDSLGAIVSQSVTFSVPIHVISITASLLDFVLIRRAHSVVSCVSKSIVFGFLPSMILGIP